MPNSGSRPSEGGEGGGSNPKIGFFAIIRQITASVTFLPILDEPCAFDLLVYTSADAAVPKTWEDSDPRYINPDQCESVRLRSFTTSVHKVDTCVMYKGGAMEDDEC